MGWASGAFAPGAFAGTTWYVPIVIGTGGVDLTSIIVNDSEARPRLFYDGNNNNSVEITEVVHTLTDQYQSNATVTCSLIRKDESVVSGGLLLNYISGTNGGYGGAFPANLDISKGEDLMLIINVTLSDGSVGEWWEPAVASDRTFLSKGACSC